MLNWQLIKHVFFFFFLLKVSLEMCLFSWNLKKSWKKSWKKRILKKKNIYIYLFGKLSPASCRLKEWGSEIEGRGGEGLLRWGVAIDSLCGDNFLSASDLSVTSHYDLCALSSTFLCDTAWGVAAFYVPPVLRECIEFSAVWLLLSANLIYPSGWISESNTEML